MAESSDEEIEAMALGGPIVHEGPIELVEYDAAWPELFVREAARIRAALGSAALAVDHVGSTSVKGLAAKPRIDIVLAVSDNATGDSSQAADEASGAGPPGQRNAARYALRLLAGPC